MKLWITKSAGLAVFSLITLGLTACSQDAPVDDVAVASMPLSEMQATSYLPLNPDKPGTPVTIQNYFVPGKYNVVVFFSPYDGLSQNLEPQLIQLTQVRNDIAVRTVNVNRPEATEGIDWQSPVLSESGIQKLPYFQIYDPSGSLRAQARPAYEQIMQWVQSLQR